MKKQYFIILFLALIVFNSCKKDKVNPGNTSTSTTVDEDKAHIRGSFDELADCITKVRDAKGTKTLTDFLGIQNGDVLNEDWATNLIDGLGDKLDFTAIDNSHRFDFAANAGTYTWDPIGQVWNKTSTPSNKIIANFPSTPGSSSNNAILTISSYTDESVDINGDTYFLPKTVTANLLVDGEEVFKVNGSVAYDAPIPINVNVSVSLKPFTYTITGNRISDTKFTAALNVSNGSGCNTTASMDFEFTHSDYETLDLSTDVKSVTARVSHNQLEVVSVIDVLSLSQIDNPTVAQINSYAKTNVFYAGSKVGELSMYEAGNGDYKVQITYKDGTSEDVEVYYQPFFDQLEGILSPLTGNVDIVI